MLDRVLEHSKKMRAKLGAADQARVDEYLSIVRSLETRMERRRRSEAHLETAGVDRYRAEADGESRRPIRSTSA